MLKLPSRVLKSPFVRKGGALVKKIPRGFAGFSANPKMFIDFPPVIVNSLPKSGTHLLLQIASALPETRNYGSFIAQRPSMSVRLRSQKEINRLIGKIVPGEVVAAHLHHSAETAALLKKKNALHLFIHRNPEDVVLSEVFYLSEMAPWNALHRRFSKLTQLDDRLELAIEGDGSPEYPDAASRYSPFLAWLEDKDTISLRYEDLMSPTQRDSELRRVAEEYLNRSDFKNFTVEDLVSRMRFSIDPERSHTYSATESRADRPKLEPRHSDRLKYLFSRQNGG